MAKQISFVAAVVNANGVRIMGTTSNCSYCWHSMVYDHDTFDVFASHQVWITDLLAAKLEWFENMPSEATKDEILAVNEEMENTLLSVFNKLEAGELTACTLSHICVESHTILSVSPFSCFVSIDFSVLM